MEITAKQLKFMNSNFMNKKERRNVLVKMTTSKIL